MQLTVLHQNENAMRPIKLKKDGTPVVKMLRSKQTQLTPTAYYQKTDATRSKYIMNCGIVYILFLNL